MALVQFFFKMEDLWRIQLDHWQRLRENVEIEKEALCVLFGLELIDQYSYVR